MKNMMWVVLLLICVSSYAQEKTQIVIRQEGFGKKHGMQLYLEGTPVETNAKGEILAKGELEITKPTQFSVTLRNGKFGIFWLEPRKGKVVVYKGKFPETIEVEGSESHSLYTNLRTANSGQVRMDILTKHPDHPAVLTYLDMDYARSELNDQFLGEFYSKANESAKAMLPNLKAYLFTKDISKVKVGAQVYDFAATDADGQTFDTKAYRGKYLLLDFASTGCGPCWKAYPDMVKIVSAYNDLQVLTYNLDESIEVWKSIADRQKVNLPWPVLWKGNDKKEIFNIYDVDILPSFFLISPKGEVLEAWGGTGKGRMAAALRKHVQ